MKTLYLLRHAKSSWDDTDLDDFDRPLNERGINAAVAMGTHIDSQGMVPQVVLCSSAVRTRQTLAWIQEQVHRELDVEFRDDLYLASAQKMLAFVCNLPSDLHSAMLIGHNPGTEALARYLVNADSMSPRGDRDGIERMRRKYPTGGLAVIATETEDWAKIDEAGTYLESFIVPKRLAIPA